MSVAIKALADDLRAWYRLEANLGTHVEVETAVHADNDGFLSLDYDDRRAAILNGTGPWIVTAEVIVWHFPEHGPRMPVVLHAEEDFVSERWSSNAMDQVQARLVVGLLTDLAERVLDGWMAMLPGQRARHKRLS